ncbi:MAG: hypothetical protein M1822_003963 [Bathelium mastoideum]|nr:MAG: hypothetical protein M1822_003963 [Bathelium mastoideum]
MSSAAEPARSTEPSSEPQENSRERNATETLNEGTGTGPGEDRGVGKDELDVREVVENGWPTSPSGRNETQNGVSTIQSIASQESTQQSSTRFENTGGGPNSGVTLDKSVQGDGQTQVFADESADMARVADQLQNTSLEEQRQKNAVSSAAEDPYQQGTEGSTKDEQSKDVSSRPQRPMRLDMNAVEEKGSTTKGQQGPAEADQSAKSEIQSIMDQFEDGMGGPGEREIMSPRLEIAQPQIFPPRSSSLEPLKRTPTSPDTSSAAGFVPISKQSTGQSVSEKSFGAVSDPRSRPSDAGIMSSDVTSSPRSSISTFKPPPPEPDPEPDLPFDFHRFLEQLRHRTADPVAKFLRSFLLEFGKKQWMVHEQVKIISDFLEFISKKMAQCEVWRTVSDAEFDNAREGMEKLVMNRLYTQTFSPAIPPPEPAASKGRRKNVQSQNGPGRKGQHQEDVERDEVLAQKVRIYGWVQEEHLDIKPVGEKGRKFLKLAQQELLKITSYRAPRDKVICVLNCCKVIFGFLRNSKSDQSADSFVPLLIYTVLQANPEHLVSNVQYILRFRNQDKLGGEAGYYMSSLMGAVQFIENLDRTSLTISDADFEKNVEAAVSAIAERHSEEESKNAAPIHPPIVSEKSTLSRPEVTPRNSLEAERSSPLRRAAQSRNTTDGSDNEENAAVAGLLRTIQKPLSTIGRIFSEESTPQIATQHQQSVPSQPVSTPRLSPSPQIFRRPSADPKGAQSSSEDKQGQLNPALQRMSAEDAAARQASAEAAEAQRISRAEHSDVVETLAGMFPDLDREVISDVVRQKEGR